VHAGHSRVGGPDLGDFRTQIVFLDEVALRFENRKAGSHAIGTVGMDDAPSRRRQTEADTKP